MSELLISQSTNKTASNKLGISVSIYEQYRSIGLKHCTVCKIWKMKIEFHKDSSRSDGLDSRCKKCKSKHDKIKNTHFKQNIPIFNYDENYRLKNSTILRLKRRLPRLQLIIILGGQCIECKYNLDIRALQIDHIKGGGTKEVKRFGSLSKMCKYYLCNIEIAKANLQVLCANCNVIKRYTNGEGYLG